MIFSKIRSSPYTSSVISALTWLPVAIFFVDHGYSYATVTGRSMQPTFNPDSNMMRKDIVLLDKWSTTEHTYKRGEVVTLSSPTNPKSVVIKRILALPGDTIKPLRKEDPVSVPAGHVWVEGDEAFHSRDSNAFGPVPIALINAKVRYVLWPPERIGPVAEKRINRDRIVMNAFNPHTKD